MANVLLDKYSAASSRFNHVVFNKETQQFERAGKRHALATFFGAAGARAKNKDTVQAIKDFMAVELTKKYGMSGSEISKDYFKSIKSSSRIESAAINRIIAKMRDDMSACPAAKNAVKEKLLKSFLSDGFNWEFLAPCVSSAEDAKEMAEMMARFLLDRCAGKVSVKDNAQLEEFRNEANTAMYNCMGRLKVFLKDCESNAEDLGKLFETFRAHGAERGEGFKCLDRFMEALFSVVENGEGVSCDKIAVSRFLAVMENGKVQERIKEGEYTGGEIAAAFTAASDRLPHIQGGQIFSAFELKLTAGEKFGNFGNANVLDGLAAVFGDVRAEDVDDFLSVTAEIFKHNKDVQGTTEQVKTCARTVNETLQFLRTQAGRHPDALKDGVQLMKDLQAPVSQDVMKSLLGMAEKVVDGLTNADRPHEESLDTNFALICFVGNAIGSPVEKEAKNWIAAKFVLASTVKIEYPSREVMIASRTLVQEKAGRNLYSIAASLNAFYARADRPLCTRYSKALDFLVDQYFNANRYKCRIGIEDEPNASRISKELVEKYDMQKCTAAKPEQYKADVSDYAEFAGEKKARADKALEDIIKIVEKAHIFKGDQIRVRQLVLQELALLSKNGNFPDNAMVERITHHYCYVAKWGGALLDRLAEVPVSDRKAVLLALEAYGCSSDAKLFDMLTKNRVVLRQLTEYVDGCIRSDARICMDAMSGKSVNAFDIHTIITGDIGNRQDLDPKQNPNLATFYSRADF